MNAVPRPSVRYAPGSWVALAGADVWLLADLAADSPIVATCWEAIEHGAGVDHLLGIILREGLRVVPNFALAGRTESAMRVLVEGKARAELRMPGDRSDGTLVTADGTPTWTERHVDGPIDLRLLSGDDAVAAGSAALLPLASGVVMAGELSLAGVEAESPRRPATIIPMPDPPIVAADRGDPADPADPSARETFRRPGGFAAAHRAAAPETLQAPLEPRPDEPAESAPPPEGSPVADLPPPATVLVPGLVESMPTPESAVAEERTGEIAGSRDASGERAWSPTTGPVAPSTSIAGIEGANPHTVQRPSAPVGTPPPAGAPSVQAIACPNRHLNPPYAGQCRLCGAPIAHQESFSVPRPTLGVLTLSSGDLVPLDRDVVLGRAPFHPEGQGTARPHLVQLPSPGNDISRSHVRIGLEGWHVQVVDLGSINGTVVSLPGQAPVRLRAHDPFTIVPGTTISLADEVTARFDSARA